MYCLIQTPAPLSQTGTTKCFCFGGWPPAALHEGQGLIPGKSTWNLLLTKQHQNKVSPSIYGFPCQYHITNVI